MQWGVMDITWSSDPQLAERQMQAIIFCLVAFGYIDSDFDRKEKKFVRDHIRGLVEHRAATVSDEATRVELIGKWTEHYHEVMDEMDRDILSHFTESVVEGETAQGYVASRLKLGCFELLKGFDDGGRRTLLSAIDELMHADGVVHDNEQAFRDDLERLLEAPLELDDTELVAIEQGKVVIDPTAEMKAREVDHPLLKPFEWDFASDPEIFKAQAAGDMKLVKRVQDLLDEQRVGGNGTLRGAEDLTAFYGKAPFLDQHVYVIPGNPAQDAELLVIGDLHGCYSCLKGALMQADFFAKVDAYKKDPSKPKPHLVLLGDYIDRGRFSYSGTLRAVMQLFVNLPDHVFMLRGNHEYYVELRGQVLAPVRPSEAMDGIRERAGNQVLGEYMKLFESLPTALAFDKTLFVHGGIPRDATLEARWEGLHSLNDREMRFEMLWSDPSDTDIIPSELQAENARFPFGRKQFQRFMSGIGCTTMVRGHERVKEGFRKIYDSEEGVLVSLFSAGGATNQDLPETSNYREVTPMALTIRYKDGVSTFVPFVIDWATYNDPEYNAFFRSAG